MKIILEKQDILYSIDKRVLADAIAEKIVESKKDWDEFDQTLLEAFKKAQKEIIKEYMEDYFTGSPITALKDAIAKMEKAELIKIITAKL